MRLHLEIDFHAAHSAVATTAHASIGVQRLDVRRDLGNRRGGSCMNRVVLEEATHGCQPQSHLIDKDLHDPPRLVAGTTHNCDVSQSGSSDSTNAV